MFFIYDYYWIYSITISSSIHIAFSPAFSFRNNKLEVVSIKEKHDYINYIKSICSRLSADYFVPFASQAIYSRPDTSWANNYKVSFEDLKNSWN